MARKEAPVEAAETVEEETVEEEAPAPVVLTEKAEWEVTGPDKKGVASATAVLSGGAKATATATPTGDDDQPAGYTVEWAVEGGAKGKAAVRGAHPLSVGTESAERAAAQAAAEAAAKEA